MSRAKRNRKAKMARRQAANRQRQFDNVGVQFKAIIERARFREELNASDLPEGAKMLLGALVDPIGFAHDMMTREMRKREETGT